MKLRNKKTGEIGNLITICASTRVFVNKKSDKVYNSLAELNEEWCDCEEPEEYWYISAYGNLAKTDVMTDLHRGAEEIGNLFGTREEAEKAVEKLKAWKRLKDKGFRFIDHIDRDSGQGMTRYEWDGYINGEDLDLLFGGEE